MTNDKVQHARELLRIALDMLDECEARVSGALVAGALDALGGSHAETLDDLPAGAPPIEAMALAIQRGRPAYSSIRSCA
ncbi:hypothetical protein EDF58_105375 [Novosphingobium sp. PhB57]|uniref:hypothetical protein n=1 Tax=Novosphingobium sp. PhB57 TaxID=2485107 RepID=UPI00104B3979|nr:hypothetical protein [Novosphingobium sp. PhB57]TCU57534.1 hypothetical protein EDF58_105375 [Novosphingobium sp. PhB57]